MTTATRFASRAYAGEADLQPLADLLNIADQADGIEEYHSLAATRTWLTAPPRDLARDVRLWTDEAGQLVATGWMRLDPPVESVDGDLYFRVHPAARWQGLEEEILAWAAARVREFGQG